MSEQIYYIRIITRKKDSFLEYIFTRHFIKRIIFFYVLETYILNYFHRLSIESTHLLQQCHSAITRGVASTTRVTRGVCWRGRAWKRGKGATPQYIGHVSAYTRPSVHNRWWIPEILQLFCMENQVISGFIRLSPDDPTNDRHVILQYIL